MTAITVPDDLCARLVATLAPQVGRLVFDQYPTGVAVGPSMQHDGVPYPSVHGPALRLRGHRRDRPLPTADRLQNAPPSILPRELPY